MARFLRVFACVWTCIGAAIIGLCCVFRVVLAESKWQGISDVLSWFSPFNFLNILAVIMLLSPAIGAHLLAELIEKHSPDRKGVGGMKRNIVIALVVGLAVGFVVGVGVGDRIVSTPKPVGPYEAHAREKCLAFVLLEDGLSPEIAEVQVDTMISMLRAGAEAGLTVEDAGETSFRVCGNAIDRQKCYDCMTALIRAVFVTDQDPQAETPRP